MKNTIKGNEEKNSGGVGNESPRPAPEEIRLLILGPTVRDEFFIADSSNHVWSGGQWRGMGVPTTFMDFRDAWIATDEARAAHPILKGQVASELKG